jgi:hypothetical protein
MQVRQSVAVPIARLRTPALVVGVLAVVTSPLHGSPWVSWAGAVLVAASVISTFVRRDRGGARADSRPEPGARSLGGGEQPGRQVPVTGCSPHVRPTRSIWCTERWQAVHAWPLMRRPEEIPGFGQPVFAPAAGRVVKAPELVARPLEPQLVAGAPVRVRRGLRRELLGLGALMGNHLVLDLGDGTYAAVGPTARQALRLEANAAMSESPKARAPVVAATEQSFGLPVVPQHAPRSPTSGAAASGRSHQRSQGSQARGRPPADTP